MRLNKDVIDLSPDIVIILAGTNDLLNTKKMVPISQLVENTRQIADALLQIKVEVVVVSPPPVDTLYLFERHDPTAFMMPPNLLLEQAGRAINDLCMEKNILFIDSHHFFKSLGIPRHNQDDIIQNENNSGRRDGVHLTRMGNVLLAGLIFEKLTEKYGRLDGLKIICFGDSLTFGPFLEGEGTSDGYTYPAVLKKLILQSQK